MAGLPKQVEEFLQCKRIAVFGVSRDKNQPANLIHKKLLDSGHKVFAINPNAEKVNGHKCYPDLRSLPEKADGAVVVTHPDVTVSVVEQCFDAGIDQIWMHRSFGQGSVSEEAILKCEEKGVNCLVGGCPMMYCEPVDFGHKCMKWFLQLGKRVPSG